MYFLIQIVFFHKKLHPLKIKFQKVVIVSLCTFIITVVDMHFNSKRYQERKSSDVLMQKRKQNIPVCEKKELIFNAANK